MKAGRLSRHPAILLVAPCVWLAHFATVYVATSLACGGIDPHPTSARVWVLGTIASATALGVALSLFAALMRCRHRRSTARDNVRSTSTFVCKVDMLLHGLAIIGMIWVAVPAFVLVPCTSTHGIGLAHQIACAQAGV